MEEKLESEEKYIRKSESLAWLIVAVVFLCISGALVIVYHLGINNGR